MFSNLKKSLIIKKYYQTAFIKVVKKIKKHVVRICYLKSKNGEHRKSLNLSKLYITLKKKWYFYKKNNIKISQEWKYLPISNLSLLTNTKILSCKINDQDIIWFY